MSKTGLTLVVKGSLADQCPDLAKDWGEENDVSPNMLTTTSMKPVHWTCHNNPEHKWMSTVKYRVENPICPGCANGEGVIRPPKKPAAGKSFQDTNPDEAAEWYQEFNGDVTPADVTPGISHYKYWWKCSRHGVVWVASPNGRAHKKGCPRCRGEKIGKKRSTLKPGDSLAEKYPDLTAEWDIQRNTITPDKVFAHGRDVAHWVCPNPDCRERYAAVVYNRTCNGSGCPKCAVKSKSKRERVPDPGHALDEMFPTIASELICTEIGETDPHKIAYAANITATWRCSVCGENVWKASVNSRTAKKKDVGGCPSCAHERAGKLNRVSRSNGVMLDDAFPDIAAEWDEERNLKELGLKLEETSVSSNAWVYWRCSVCDRPFYNSVNHRTSRGDGCSYCNNRFRVSFPEKATLYYVQKIYPDAAGNTTPDIDDFGKRELDIWIPSINTGIEYDGGGWHQDKQRDLEKEELCFKNGITLIKIHETTCVDMNHMASTTIILRDPNKGYDSLSSAIIDAIRSTGYNGDLDVDVKRDNADIRINMHLDFVKNSLAVKRPDVAKLWGDNRGLTAYMFKPHSSEMIHWKCTECGEEWDIPIVRMTKRKKLCQSCGLRSCINQ